jgi:putative resolvase
MPPTPATAASSACARVSSHDEKVGLDQQAPWAAQSGQSCRPVAGVEAEVGSGMNGARSRVRRLLADPLVRVVVAEHRSRLGRVNTELAEAALSASGRRLVVPSPAGVGLYARVSLPRPGRASARGCASPRGTRRR